VNITSLEETAVDVGAWLNSLGLGQYEAAFRENAVDAELLPTLTADDLKDLGVTLVGHRRCLLDAIAKLQSEMGLCKRSAHLTITQHRHQQKMWFRRVASAAN
jgi:SAM domain (Sterile alpha motif)